MPTDAQRRNLASAHCAEVKSLNEQIALLEQQLAEARKDSERYRKLRRGNYPVSLARSILNDTPHGIDTAVDAITEQP